MSNLPTAPQERKGIPIGTGVLDYFPLTMAEVARVSKIGNDQHNPGQPLHWDRSKSTDEYDCMTRHGLQRYERDTDGTYHAAKMVWRAMAFTEKFLEEQNRKDSDANSTPKPNKEDFDPDTLELVPGQLIQCNSVQDGQQELEEARNQINYINGCIRGGYSASLAYVVSSNSTHIQLYRKESPTYGISGSIVVRGKVRRKKDRERGDIQPKRSDGSESQLTLWDHHHGI